MKRKPQWGDFNRMVRLNWTESDLYMARWREIEKGIKKKRSNSK